MVHDSLILQYCHRKKNFRIKNRSVACFFSNNNSKKCVYNILNYFISPIMIDRFSSSLHIITLQDDLAYLV